MTYQEYEQETVLEGECVIRNDSAARSYLAC